MPIATGIFKSLAYKVESTYGTAPAASGAQYLRRVESTLNLVKEAYQSSEKRTDQQVYDMRHGVRRVQGNIRGELSPLTYEAFFAALVRKAWAATTAMTAVGITIAAGSLLGTVQSYTITRSAGSWLTSGVKVGDVLRLSVGSLNANNLNKNILVVSITSATVLVGITLNGTALTAEGPITGCTVTVVGKKTQAPESAHTDLSYSIEHWHSDVAKSELFTGCKPTQVAVDLPPTGLATVDWTVQGQDITRGTAQYYTSPTAATSTGLTAAVNGVLLAGGIPQAIVTGANFSLAGNFSGDPVVGRNTVPNVFPGRIAANGQLTAYFDSTTLRDAFIDETELSLILTLTAANTAAADFLSFTFPRIKLSSATKDDPEGGIRQTLGFSALKLAGSTDTDNTTVVIQDSAVP